MDKRTRYHLSGSGTREKLWDQVLKTDPADPRREQALDRAASLALGATGSRNPTLADGIHSAPTEQPPVGVDLLAYAAWAEVYGSGVESAGQA